MTNPQNYTFKMSLDDANTVRRALTSHLERLQAELIDEMADTTSAAALNAMNREEYGRTEALLRRL